MSARRALVGALVLLTALAVQASVLPVLAQAGLFWSALVPNLCLLVVVALALTLDPTAGALVGFGVGLLLDLAPPADHTAGRWALALLVVGFVAGHLAGQLGAAASPSRLRLAGLAAACSFVGSSVFALSGRLIGDLTAGVPGLLAGIALTVLADTVAASLLLPGVRRLLEVPPPVEVPA